MVNIIKTKISDSPKMQDLIKWVESRIEKYWFWSDMPKEDYLAIVGKVWDDIREFITEPNDIYYLQDYTFTLVKELHYREEKNLKLARGIGIL